MINAALIPTPSLEVATREGPAGASRPGGVPCTYPRGRPGRARYKLAGVGADNRVHIDPHMAEDESLDHEDIRQEFFV